MIVPIIMAEMPLISSKYLEAAPCGEQRTNGFDAILGPADVVGVPVEHDKLLVGDGADIVATHMRGAYQSWRAQ